MPMTDRGTIARVAALAMCVATMVGGAIGYAVGRSDTRDSQSEAYRSGFSKAAERWPIRRELYSSEAAWREAVRQAKR